MPYTPVQRTWAQLLTRAESEFADNTQRLITEQIAREFLMDFVFTTQQLGSKSMTDTDGDTFIQVELGDDDDTIRFNAGGTAVGTMQSSGGFPIMSFGGLPFGSGIEMTTNQVRLRSYGGPVARFGDNGSSGTGFYLGDLDSNYNPVSGGNFIQYEGDTSGIYISADELSFGKVGQDRIIFPGHATIKSDTPAGVNSSFLFLDANGLLRHGPAAPASNSSADGSVRWVLDSSGGSNPQAVLEFSDTSLAAPFAPIIRVTFTSDQQVDIGEALPASTVTVPILEWGHASEDNVGFVYRDQKHFQVGRVSGGTGMVAMGDVVGDSHEAYVFITDGEFPSGLPNTNVGIEVSSPDGFRFVINDTAALADFSTGSIRWQFGDIDDAVNGTVLTIEDANERLTFNKTLFLTDYTGTPSPSNTTTTALTVDPTTGQVAISNIVSSGGSVGAMNDLSDANTANKTLADGDVMLYNLGATEWQATASVNIYDAAIMPTGGDATLLSTGGNWDANNIYTGSALAGTYPAGLRYFSGQFLYEYDGTNWHRQAKSASAGGVTAINDLSDVDTATAAPTDLQVLTWIAANSAWEPRTASSGGGASAVNDLTDAYYSSAGVFGMLSNADFASLEAAGKSRIFILGQSAGANYQNNVTTNAAVDLTLIGYFAGDTMVDGHRVTAVGSRCAMDSDTNNSVYFGWEAGRAITGDNNVMIGPRAGFSETISNAMVIKGNNEFIRIVQGSPNIVRIPLLNGYADEAAATTAGLLQGDLYYNTTGNHVDQVRT